ncbi:hypothetical protein, partial [Kaarinaea lacus]
AELRQQQQERERRCQKARADLRYYERSRALYTKDDKGERNFISDAQREEIIRQQREVVTEWCD